MDLNEGERRGLVLALMPTFWMIIDVMIEVGCTRDLFESIDRSTEEMARNLQSPLPEIRALGEKQERVINTLNVLHTLLSVRTEELRAGGPTASDIRNIMDDLGWNKQ